MILWLFLACASLGGDWAGEVDCGSYAMDVELSLAWTEGLHQGEGELDCTDAYGMDCTQRFEIEVETGSRHGAQELEVDLDDCFAETATYTGAVDCDNPDDIEWDGGDRIDGDWVGCEVELERE